MKTQSDYAALLEECLLLMITSAAFYLNLAEKSSTPCLSGMLENFSRLFEKHAYSLSEIVLRTNAPHLNPAYLNRATDHLKTDLETAQSDIFALKSRLLYLSAYAPDAFIRHHLIKITNDATLIADFLSSIM